MKKLLLAMLLAASQAHADTAATTGNGNGGVTILTDVDCERGRGYIAYAQSPRSSTFFGCWWSDDSMVHITWQDGDTRSYPFNIFTANTNVLNRMRSRNSKGNV